MKKNVFIILIMIFLTASAASTNALMAIDEKKESLANKVIRAEKMLKESDRLIRYGNYDEGRRLAEEVKKLTADIYFLMGNSRRYNKLLYTIAVAIQVGAEKWAKEPLKQARFFARKAKKIMTDKEKYYEFESYIIQGQELAMSAIEISKVSFEEQNTQLKVVLTPEGEEQRGVSNQNPKSQKNMGTYIVKMIPERRECLWRIAEYDFIYNDGFKWEIIYSANTNIIKDPDLIYPGQELTIPPLK